MHSPFLFSILDSTQTVLLRGFAEIIGQTLWLLLVLITPFVVFTVLIHFLELGIQGRLASRFGWKSVLWTGWLGTPIHELSHWIMCKAFRHRVLEMELFEPDKRTGRLGFVRHSWSTGNWFEEAGNFFIGLAPLAGGSLALAGLLWLFYPDAAINMISGSDPGSVTTVTELSAIGSTFNNVRSLLGHLLAPTNLLSWKFWAFTYLVLCVGGHMAPSRSDYDGASRGVLLVVSGIVLCLLLVSLLGFETDRVVKQMLKTLSPLFALQIIAIVVCSFATGIVYLITAFFPERFSVT